jgi:hypothetical protein
MRETFPLLEVIFGWDILKRWNYINYTMLDSKTLARKKTQPKYKKAPQAPR